MSPSGADHTPEMNATDSQLPAKHPRRKDTDPPPRYQRAGRTISDAVSVAFAVVRLTLIYGAFLLAPTFRGLLPTSDYGAPLAAPASQVLRDLDAWAPAMLLLVIVVLAVIGVFGLLFDRHTGRALGRLTNSLSTPALLFYLWALAPALVMFLARSGAIG